MISACGFTRLTWRMKSNVRSVSPSGSSGGATMNDSSGITPLRRHSSATSSVWSERVPLRIDLQ